jgi:putative acetyltransferase
VIVERVELLSPDSQHLISLLNAELEAMYPEEGANHFQLDAAELAPGRGGFFVARDGAPLGCGAVRLLDGERAEIKRMFVVGEARGRGVGRLLMTALCDEARRLGAKRLVLETGTRQLAALALYQRTGFVPTEAWGEYIGSPLSVCMMLEL